jgi:hypothetical protein
MNSPNYLRRVDAARHVREAWGLPCSPRWLAKLAVTGGGPIYRKAGRTPIYSPGRFGRLGRGADRRTPKIDLSQSVRSRDGEAVAQPAPSEDAPKLYRR